MLFSKIELKKATSSRLSRGTGVQNGIDGGICNREIKKNGL